MLVACPDCNQSYRLSATDLGERGRVVVCSVCDACWFQSNDAADHDENLRGDSFGAEHGPGRTLPFAVDDDTPFVPSAPEWAVAALKDAQVFLAASVLAILAVATIAKRDLIVRAMPRTAPLYAAIGLPVNLRGLDFAAVASMPSASNDVEISGEIRNIAGRRLTVPRVAFVVRDGSGATLMSWSETPPAATLAGGRTLAFRSEPHRLPPEGRTVLVRFDDDGAGPGRRAGSTF